MRARYVAIAVAAVLVVAGVALWFLRPVLFGRGKSTEVSIDEVLRRYQEATTPVDVTTAASTTVLRPDGSAVTTSVVVDPVRPLRPGVYVYETTGRDEIDALNGDFHDYPETTTITVFDLGDGCRRFRWDVLMERWQEWERCERAGAVVPVQYVNFDTFFGQSQTDTYLCEGESRPLDAEPGTTWTFTCTKDRPDVHSGQVIGRERLTVGGVEVDALHVRVSIDNGYPQDVQITDSWFLLGTDLLLAQTATNDTTNPSPIGDVHYTERYELRLTSLDPLN